MSNGTAWRRHTRVLLPSRADCETIGTKRSATLLHSAVCVAFTSRNPQWSHCTAAFVRLKAIRVASREWQMAERQRDELRTRKMTWLSRKLVPVDGNDVNVNYVN